MAGQLTRGTKIGLIAIGLYVGCSLLCAGAVGVLIGLIDTAAQKEREQRDMAEDQLRARYAQEEQAARLAAEKAEKAEIAYMKAALERAAEGQSEKEAFEADLFAAERAFAEGLADTDGR